ncbi:MAG: hypothetical protein HC923_05560 [Myxococcales bacterium]|nr:hypothetical protein [Myxococcales bacterium]
MNDLPVILGQRSTLEVPDGVLLGLRLEDLEVQDVDDPLDALELVIEPGEAYVVEGSSVRFRAGTRGATRVIVRVRDTTGPGPAGVLAVNVTLGRLTEVVSLDATGLYTELELATPAGLGFFDPPGVVTLEDAPRWARPGAFDVRWRESGVGEAGVRVQGSSSTRSWRGPRLSSSRRASRCRSRSS